MNEVTLQMQKENKFFELLVFFVTEETLESSKDVKAYDETQDRSLERMRCDCMCT